MDKDEAAEHRLQHRELALYSNGEPWLDMVRQHLRQMHGIEEAADPVFLHRHLHSPGDR